MINQDFLDKIDHPAWRSLIFTLCFMHSIVIERKKFGPIGWCVPYEYNNSDLEASLMFIEKYLNSLIGPSSSQQQLQINCTVIKYMICQIQYGGRITDQLDRDLFDSYGDDYIKEGIFGNEHVYVEVTIENQSGNRERVKYKMLNHTLASEIKNYIDYVDQIPASDNPEIFGLHANSDLNFRLKESIEMIDTIIETRPKDSSSGGGKTREELVQDKSREIL